MIATNGGSDYRLVPDHNTTVVQNLVTFLQQSARRIGAMFVNSMYRA